MTTLISISIGLLIFVSVITGGMGFLFGYGFKVLLDIVSENRDEQ